MLYIFPNISVVAMRLSNESSKCPGAVPPAVLKVDSRNLPVLSLADSNRVRAGDVCLALGNPLGIGQTVPLASSCRATGRA